MQLINTDGMALIGPGSEWFWTALTGLVLAITFVAIYRQLSTARSASAYEQLTAFEEDMVSERLIRHQLAVMVALHDGKPLPFTAANAVAGFWERIGGLARRRYLDAELLWNGSGGECVTWWTWLAPYAEARRAELGPTQYEHFEWLAGVMAALDRRAGVTRADAGSRDKLPLRISYYRDLLRVEESLRTVSPPRERSDLAAPAAVADPTGD